MRNAPYTQIFPEGIDYHTAAPLDQEVTRYGQLVYRLKQFDHHHPSSRRNHHIHHTLHR